MANPMGDNGMFQPEAQYGQIAAMRELSREAPISGAPVPGAGTTNKPATAGGPGPAPAGPMATPFTPAPSGVGYYHRLADTWRALAALPGASDTVKAMAKQSKKRVVTEYQLAQQVGQ